VVPFFLVFIVLRGFLVIDRGFGHEFRVFVLNIGFGFSQTSFIEVFV